MYTLCRRRRCNRRTSSGVAVARPTLFVGPVVGAPIVDPDTTMSHLLLPPHLQHWTFDEKSESS